ncbi:MAG: RNA polymerase sigma factor [Sedimentisphaerales bacterium]|nr:RNA polymerase sigma factor [Sedimentisphaerales bacterium]
MDQQTYQIELIKKAQQGDKNSLDQLAVQAKDRLHTYVLRMTQQEDLAQEIVQESLLEMFKVIGKLREADRFWPWLYGIATNKLRRFYRTEATHRRVAVASLEKKGSMEDRQDGFQDLVGDELKQIVSGAMKKLKTSHKAVLVMRCYDDMPYSEIAETMGTSEFSTRMLFLRAKRALQKELSKNGFAKGSFLAAMILFGKMTAPTKAAAAEVTIAAATLKVGVAASAVGLATSKTAILSLAAAGVLTTGTVVMKPELFNLDSAAQRNSAVLVQDNNGAGQNIDTGEEYQWFFPQGPSGPVMMQVRLNSSVNSEYRKVLQNQHGNYYYNGNGVKINNHHMYAEDLSVIQMPTDDPQMSAFISKVEGVSRGIEHITASGRGLLVIEPRNIDSSDNRPLPIRHKNVLDEDYFQADWSINSDVTDNRDQMHKRGWTYFRISGRVNGQDVTGRGRIPFLYSASEKYSPWLRLQTGDMLMVDTNREAYIYKKGNDRIELYKSGSFFEGLARPWMGLHAIDTIRRDAAEQKIKFETQYVEGSDNKIAQVKLITDNVTFIYNIDMQNDVINEISFSTKMGIEGNLKFTYLQNVEGLDTEFAVPPRPGQKTTSMDSHGVLWLTKLLGDSHE